MLINSIISDKYRNMALAFSTTFIENVKTKLKLLTGKNMKNYN